MLPKYAGEPSKTRLKDSLFSWLRIIISDSKSRNLFFYLLINFTFAFVELTYGIWTNSLGLITDSFHMFFDCTALIAGLIASVIAKWRATDKYTYGYVRAEVLTGFVNGLFLVFVAFFILTEAVERLFEPPEILHERLLIVSVMGFCVNMIGIFAFSHGHSHGGGSHGHSHGGDSHGHSHDCDSHGHNTTDNHGHSHGQFQIDLNNVPNGTTSQQQHSSGSNKIFQGVFLHILADTLGSVGVIISSLLIRFFDWHIADPICSLIIACLITLSVIPLLRDSGAILMQRQPQELDHLLPDVYKKISQIEGVISVQSPHFWTLCSEKYVGAIRIEAKLNYDPRYLLSTIKSLFLQIGVQDIYIQIDYI